MENFAHTLKIDPTTPGSLMLLLINILSFVLTYVFVSHIGFIILSLVATVVLVSLIYVYTSLKEVHKLADQFVLDQTATKNYYDDFDN